MATLIWPKETSNFEAGSVNTNPGQSVAQFARLHDMELRDVNQQIKMRPYVAGYFAFILLIQVVAVFSLVYLALKSQMMKELQLIFSVLVAGTLTQSYKIAQLIVNKLFEQIDYKDKHERFKY